MLILGVESSCDETAAAVVDGDGLVRSDVVQSQVALHGPYGGVVPELAARDHLAHIAPVVERALSDAGASLGDLDAIAVTVRPGLAGALLVGAQFARTLSWAHRLPIVGVDHLVGHLLAVFLKRPGAEPPPMPSFPFVALLVSGGHTAIYRVDGPLVGQIRELGATRDDAAGEAFDKAAKLMGLGYPGGPVVDRLAALGDPKALDLPLPMMEGLEFSFSGLKSQLARHVERHGQPTGQALHDLCAAFQGSAVEVLARKVVRAARAEGVPNVVLCGGVAANRGLRARAADLCARHRLSLFVPPVSSCTDNGAMIAYAGLVRFAAGERDDLSLTVNTRTSLPRVTRKGRGLRA
ncbi:MAG: tRNA (adenosine(37)-N6)-threonylcarbamoyltransferase complex transferase subunit TsaD [Myxococcales bacterium]|nr:MAG: tRNA (adenosine(37)-N6)-threonylcarbamoyltransferase complex transferase subunit TsaD [Myxococcales bacterium]